MSLQRTLSQKGNIAYIRVHMSVPVDAHARGPLVRLHLDDKHTCVIGIRKHKVAADVTFGPKSVPLVANEETILSPICVDHFDARNFRVQFKKKFFVVCILERDWEIVCFDICQVVNAVSR